MDARLRDNRGTAARHFYILNNGAVNAFAVIADIVFILHILFTMPSSRGRRWVFTWQNYPADYRDVWATRLREAGLTAKYVCMGEEVAPTTNTRHLQSCVWFNSRITNPRQKLNLGSNWELARSWDKAVLYCKKGNQSHDEWTTQGADGPNYGLNAVIFEVGDDTTTQGQRTDLDRFKEAVTEANGTYTFDQAMEEHSSVVAQYERFVRSYITLHRPVREVETHALRPWQQQLNAMLIGPPHPRHIIFVVDAAGNAGKSWFAAYYRMLHSANTQIIAPGKENDMAYLIKETSRVLFFDLPRSRVDHFSWSFLETVKNGEFDSHKYEPTKKWFLGVPHIVVMMNQQPDRTLYSADRYMIINTN